jgi:putative transposase
MKRPSDPHYRHRFPVEVISHAVWLYHTFSLSFRDVELLLAERGVLVSYETVRRWCKKFGETFAGRMRRRQPRPGDKWHMDEGFIRIQGTQHYLWRAVDQDGVVLDILVQPRRDSKAAKRFFKKLLKGYRARCCLDGDLIGSRQHAGHLERTGNEGQQG